MTDLTDMQKRYIWLAGSYPLLVVKQGRGYRGLPLLYGISEDDLYIFGYSNPLYWLENRGLFKKLQDGMSYALTEAGDQEFGRLLLSGFGGRQAETMKLTKLKAKT